MYLLRHVAVRALSHQPARQLSSLRATSTRVTRTSGPAVLRSFHQSQLWLAGEKAASPVDAQTSGETVTTSPSAQEEQTRNEVVGSTDAGSRPSQASVDAVSEASGSTAEPVDSPIQTIKQDSAPALNTSSVDANAMPSSTSGAAASKLPRENESSLADSSALDKAYNTASAAVDAVRGAGASAAATARSAFDQTASDLQKPSAEFPPRTPAPAAATSPTNSAAQQHGRSLRSDAAPNKTWYVGNLFFEVTAPQLEAEFSRFGSIKNSRVVTDSRGLSKGFGYVEFEEQDSADRAVKELDQKVFQGRRMAVQYHVQRAPRGPRDGTAGGFGGRGGLARPPNPPSKTLFIGNMSYQMSDRDLNDLFREIRNVLDVRVAIDRRSGQPRGFAHADFIDVQSAERAKEHLEKKVIYGRQLKVDFSANSASTRGTDVE